MFNFSNINIFKLNLELMKLVSYIIDIVNFKNNLISKIKVLFIFNFIKKLNKFYNYS